MPLSQPQTIEILQEQLDPTKATFRATTSADGYHIGIARKNPGTPEERRAGKKKWESIGGITYAEFDLILRTSLDEKQAARRIIDRVLHGKEIPGADAAVETSELSPRLQALINQKVEALFAERLAAIQSGERRVSEVAAEVAAEVVVERANEIAKRPQGLQRTGHVKTRSGESKAMAKAMLEDKIRVLNERAMALNWKHIPERWVGGMQAKLKREWLAAGGEWEFETGTRVHTAAARAIEAARANKDKIVAADQEEVRVEEQP